VEFLGVGAVHIVPIKEESDQGSDRGDDGWWGRWTASTKAGWANGRRVYDASGTAVAVLGTLRVCMSATHAYWACALFHSCSSGPIRPISAPLES